MTARLTLAFFIVFSFSTLSLFAQTGTIAGKIIDAKFADVVIGATVRVDPGTAASMGASTDLDGNYIIKCPVGKHKIVVSYLGYADKTIDEIDVKANEAITIDLALEEAASTTIAEVVITAKASRESQSALTILQKNSPVIADGISAETIKRTPDRTTGDVLRRVSGASVQDGRFAIIRGLNDRYNVAMVNGALLSSTEPDRRAFSFDIFPSSLLDNLVIVKTASPDLPGEFAGGVIMMNTKDIPEDNYLNVQVNGGYNTVTTFKDYKTSQSGNRDWLGIDDGSRALPDNFPANSADYTNLSIEERTRLAQAIPNTWSTKDVTARPNLGAQITAGYVKALGAKSKIGATLGLTYSSSLRYQETERRDYDQNGLLYLYNDKQYNTGILWGALANIGYVINERNKVTFQSTYTQNSDNNVYSRTGVDTLDNFGVRSQAVEFITTGLLSTRLSGEHVFGDRAMKVEWGFGLNKTDRSVPDVRRILYRQNRDFGEDAPFAIFIPQGGGDAYRTGRVYLDLEEKIQNGNIAFSFPFSLFKQKQTFKVGGLYQGKQREFAGRLLGVVSNGNTSAFRLLPVDSVFATQNFKTSNGFRYDDITAPSDKYSAESDLTAAFAMFQNNFGKFKLTWGVRAENFSQRVFNTLDRQDKPVSIERDTLVLLPSFNLTYELTEKINLRLCGSQTTSRPEFRELSPFSFFEFVTQTQVYGNPSLNIANIYNADVRFEYYPGENQLLSVSGFYKKFENPIEQVMAQLGATTRERTFKNVKSAVNYGLEIEARKNFGFINDNFKNLVAFANLALIQSSVDLEGTSSPNKDRPLQGQSPYVLNVGLQASFPDLGLNSTLVFNRVGDRVFEVGVTGYNDIYERHRNLLDFQIAKRIGKLAEIKLNWQDILRPDYIYYQDANNDGKYQAPTGDFQLGNGEDNLIQRVKVGSTISLSFSMRF